MIRRISLVLAVGFLTACGQAPSTTSATSSSSSTSLVTTPYAFTGDSSCWTDSLKTNGASFDNPQSTYVCHVTNGGLGNNITQQEIWIGVYADGTLSYSRRDVGQSYFYGLGNASGCQLYFDNSVHSKRYVILQVGTIDSDGHLATASQIYYDTPGGTSDTYQIACKYHVF